MMEDYEPDGIESAVENVEAAVERVETAVLRVETAVKEKWSTVQFVGVMLIGAFLWSVPGQIWHSKWRYAANYNIQSSDVHVQDQPHDCAFLAAPLGTKYCHYDRTASITRWGTSPNGNPVISYDDGKTWNTFDPAGKYVPKYSTVKEIYIGWEKKED